MLNKEDFLRALGDDKRAAEFDVWYGKNKEAVRYESIDQIDFNQKIRRATIVFPQNSGEIISVGKLGDRVPKDRKKVYAAKDHQRWASSRPRPKPRRRP